jgi:hypothetical protein
MSIRRALSKRKYKTHDVVFDPPPLFEGEDEAAYKELLARVMRDVAPRDIFEEIWTRDLVDLTWDIIRWRHMRPDLFKVEDTKGIQFLDKTATMLGRAERIEQLIAFAEQRRNAAYREIRGHRAAFADRLRNRVEQVELSRRNVPQVVQAAPESCED